MEHYGNGRQSIMYTLPNRVNEIMKSLHNTNNWYNFLINLSGKITPVIADRSRKMLNSLDQKCKKPVSDKFNVSDIGLKEFLTQMSLPTVPHNVENYQVNLFELRMLIKILDQIVVGYNVSQSGNKLSVKGTNIKISDVIRMDEWNQATTIELLALQSILIYADINRIGHNVQLTFIAPVWDISGQRQINLNGAAGTPHPHPMAINGENGKPGTPGSPAGSFFGVGSHFSHNNTLSILANGGNGAAGQNGGHGRFFFREFTANKTNWALFGFDMFPSIII